MQEIFSRNLLLFALGMMMDSVYIHPYTDEICKETMLYVARNLLVMKERDSVKVLTKLNPR
jgi:hypothetical protein